MKKSRFSEEQIAYALRESDAGTAVADVCRQLGVSEASIYGSTRRTLGPCCLRVRERAGRRKTPGDLPLRLRFL